MTVFDKNTAPSAYTEKLDNSRSADVPIIKTAPKRGHGELILVPKPSPPPPPTVGEYIFLPSFQTYGGYLPTLIGVGGSNLIGMSANNDTYASSDALTWSRFGNASGKLLCMTAGNGVYVGAGLGGAVETSNDGRIWTPQISNITDDMHAIWYDESQTRFVAVGNNGVITTSNDSVNWTGNVTTGGADTVDVTYGNGLFITVDVLGKTEHADIHAQNWSTGLPGDGSVMLAGATYSPDLSLFAVVGAAGAFYTSPDGLSTWNNLSGVITANDLTCIAWGNNHFAACDTSGKVWRSSNGTVWALDVRHDVPIKRIIFFASRSKFLVLEQ